MDTRRPRSLRDFIELARRKSAESRSELLGNIADLFLNDRVRLSDRERSLMTGILRALIATVETALLRELAARVGEGGDIPDALDIMLTGKPVEIARPILMRSQALRTPELVEQVKHRCREHQLAVSMHPSLAANTGDRTAPRRDDDVIESLLRGPEGPLSRQAANYLVAESERIDRLNMPVLTLADLSDAMARRLHWWVAAALRAHIVDQLSVSPSHIDEPLEAATRGVIERRTAQGSDMATQARRLVERMAEHEPLTPETLTRLLRAGRVPAFIAGVAHLAKLPWPVTQRIVLRPDGESLALICKAASVDADAFLSLYEMITSVPAGTARLPADERNSILAFYDKVTKGNARAAVNFWRRDPDFVSAMEQVNPVAEDPPASQ